MRILLALLLGLTACEGKRSAPAEAAPVVARQAEEAPAKQAPPARQAAPGPVPMQGPVLTGKPEFEKAAEGDVATLVQEAEARAVHDHRRLLVYVGAPWCEPCTAFHEAVDGGKLDDVFPGLRFLEFNMDVDGKRLADAGYTARLIPIFAIPGRDGRNAAHISGGIKGPRAVEHLTERLRPLLEQNR